MPPGDEIFFTQRGVDIIIPEERFFLPFYPEGIITHYNYYSISYEEKISRVNWISYMLTRENFLREKTAKHSNISSKYSLIEEAENVPIKADSFINTSLIPAEFMSFDELAAKENSIDSNMIIMHTVLKNCLWKQLTENIRKWTMERRKLYIVSGTIENGPAKLNFDSDKTTIPDQLYTLILDIHSGNNKGIAFLLPNRKDQNSLYDHAVSIDSIEKLTGIRFFHNLITEEELAKIKTTYDIESWPFIK
jgi:endonuclease G